MQMEAINTVKLSLEELSGTRDWPMMFAEDAPQQTNGSDCGVFTIVGCECAAFGLPTRMEQGKSQFFRQKIAVDIINGRLV